MRHSHPVMVPKLTLHIRSAFTTAYEQCKTEVDELKTAVEGIATAE